MTRVIGIGQPFAGDDDVGREVARRLRAHGVPADEAADGAGLLALLAGARRVIVVDAAVGAGPAGTVRVLAPGELPPPERSMSSHGLSVAEALALAQVLHRGLEVRVVAIAIAPPSGLGAGLSPEAAGAVDVAVAKVRALLQASSGQPTRPAPALAVDERRPA